MRTSRLEAVPPSRLTEQRQHRLDTKNFVSRRADGSQDILLVKEKGVFRVGLVVNRWKRCGKAELSFVHSHTQNEMPAASL